MNTRPILVFDFDGTISDSVEAMFEILNDLSESFGFKKIRNEEFSAFRKMSTEEMIKKLRIAEKFIPKIMDGIHKGLAKRAASLKPVDGMVEVLTSLAKSGYKMFIVTSNTKANVYSFLKKFNINYFDRIYPKSGLYGKSNLIKKLLKDSGANNELMFFVGDEVRDVKAGKDCGVKTVAVGWGLNGREVLVNAKPDWLIDTPKQLLGIFK